jgi:hypothetical protein
MQARPPDSNSLPLLSKSKSQGGLPNKNQMTSSAVPKDRKVMAYPLQIDESIISPQDDNPNFVDFFEMIANDSYKKSQNEM